MNVVIHSLRKDIGVLKQEKDRALRVLNKERRNAQDRDSSNSESVTRVKSEYEEKISIEREKSQRTITELKRKHTVTESKVREIESKYRDEIHTLEAKYEEQRIELESRVHQAEEEMRSRLHVEHQVRLKEEKEKYEETLRGLRREISALQEQRKQIQFKLKTTEMPKSQRTLPDRAFVTYNKDRYSKLEYEHKARLAEEKKKLEDRIEDLQREVQELKREKTEIKSSYREEKAQREAEFQKEKERLGERYRRERDELRRKLEGGHGRVLLVKEGRVSRIRYLI